MKPHPFLCPSCQKSQEVKKSQEVRLLDVFVLGPFMVWFGATSQHHPFLRAAMMGAGVATVAYNWNNYQKNKEIERGAYP